MLKLAEKLGKGVIIKKGLQSGHADSASGGGGIRAAFEHVLGLPGVSSMIVGTINPDHLRSNAETVNELMQDDV